MKASIAILLPAPLTSQNLARTGTVILSEHFQVFIIDCSRWVYPNSTAQVDKVEWESLTEIDSLDGLRNFLTSTRIDFAIDFIGDLPIRNQIARTLSDFNSYLVIQKLGQIPRKIRLTLRIREITTKSINLLPARKGKGALSPSTISKRRTISLPTVGIIDRLKKIVLDPVTLRRSNPYVVLQTGDRSSTWMSILARRVIRIASNDYHTFTSNQAESKKMALTNRSFVLFIDDCLIEALDWQILGVQPPINKEKYFAALNSFFDKLEERLKMQIIIAGHPNTSGNNAYDANFRHRKVVYSQTSKLTQDSSLVLLHASTAASFAVLAEKPLVTLTSDEISHTLIGRQVQAVSHALGTKMVNIDHVDDEIEIPKINKRKYRNYKNHFVKGDRVQEMGQLQNFIDAVPQMLKRND